MRFITLIAAALVLTCAGDFHHLAAADAKSGHEEITKAKLPFVRGVIASIDTAKSSITIRIAPPKGSDSSPMVKTVYVGFDTVLLLDDKTAKLVDLRVGDPIFARYNDSDVASSVRDHRAELSGDGTTRTTAAKRAKH